MGEIRLRVVLNKGRKGIPLHKLAAVTEEVQKFLRTAAADVSLDERARWLAHDFRNGSLDFLIERAGAARPAEIFDWKALIREVATYRGRGTMRYASAATLRQYARIAAPLDEDEVAEIGLPPDDEDKLDAVEKFELTKKVSRIIEEAVAPLIEYRGAIHGVIHSLFKESEPPHFQVRELVTRRLVRCIYPRAQYYEVVRLLERRDAIVYVAGLVRASRIGREIEEVRVEKMKAAPDFTDADFAHVFGSAPGITGKETTGEFLQRLRDDAD